MSSEPDKDEWSGKRPAEEPKRFRARNLKDEDLLIQVRMTALTAAATSTPDMDPETTLEVAGQFEEWILRGIRR